MNPIEIPDSPIEEESASRSSFTVGDGDGDSISSSTIDNDPDRFYYINSEEDERDASPSSPNSSALRRPEIVDLTTQTTFSEGDYLTDDCIARLFDDWTPEDQQSPPQASEDERKRVIPEACIDGIIYKPGQSLELYNGSYLRIITVLQDAAGGIFFRGRHLIKTVHHDKTYIPKWHNELVWIANEAVDIAVELVERFVNIAFTNHCHVDEDARKAKKARGLFCRLKEVEENNEVSVEYLSFAEADEGFNPRPRNLRYQWRGETRSFGELDLPPNPWCVIDLTETDGEENAEDLKENRRYTFGDGFCGAGGVSCGAHKAGMEVKWAFDLSEHAISTYRLNFQNAICENSDIYSFLTNSYEFLKVDVSHGSPPCQTFSPAHTIESANDDANSACIFSCADMIRKARPRVHTMEETSGLPERHKNTFYRVIQDFIETGYSVRWNVLNCVEYGVPQLRRRLMVIASGPGERLPSFPRPTHGPGLRRVATINQMIANIPLGTPDHDVQGAQSRGIQKAPYDANQQARTITCGGGDNNYHPSGTRGFTNREFACLQTFPLAYRFGRQEVRKQIGNAVPPVLAQGVYGEIIRSLQRTDEEEL